MDRNDPRRKQMARSIDNAVSASRLSTMQRMGEAKEPLHVTVCLGPGRCLIPGADKSPTVCPFCTPVSLHAGQVVDVEALAQRVFGGN